MKPISRLAIILIELLTRRASISRHEPPLPSFSLLASLGSRLHAVAPRPGIIVISFDDAGYDAIRAARKCTISPGNHRSGCGKWPHHGMRGSSVSEPRPGRRGGDEVMPVKSKS